MGNVVEPLTIHSHNRLRNASSSTDHLGNKARLKDACLALFLPRNRLGIEPDANLAVARDGKLHLQMPSCNPQFDVLGCDGIADDFDGISRSITDKDGFIRPEFRDLKTLQEQSTIGFVTTDINEHPEAYEETPGEITRDMIEPAFEPKILGADIDIILVHGLANACNASVAQYLEWREESLARFDALQKEK